MKQHYTKILMFIGLLSLLIMPNSALAAQSAGGIEFRVAYTDGRYEVFMRPNINATGPALTLTAQVTLKVPHAIGADRFLVTDTTSGVVGTEWTESSRIDAPVEDTTADYLSFTLNFPEGSHLLFDWQSDVEIKVFSFANQGTCEGSVSLLSNDDSFNSDVAAGVINSANTNPGNQIDVLNLGDGNLYLGNYGSAASCGDRRAELENFLYLPLVNK